MACRACGATCTLEQAQFALWTVRGLVALLLMPFQGKTADEIIAYDPNPYVQRLGLEQALSMKRRAGMQEFFARVRQLAAAEAGA